MDRARPILRVGLVAVALIVSSAPALVEGHEHHASLEDINSAENALKPLGSRLWYHIAIQAIVWTFLFPLGMVLGLTRSKWHVPVVSTATLLSLFGLYFGHHHDGRAFPSSPHGTMGSWLTWIMLLQGALGSFLRMHVMEGTVVRKVALLVHGFFGKIYPLLGFFQMLMGVILGLGFCYGGHFGQCLAHFGFGSAFMAYATLTLIMSFFGRRWLAARNISQEFLDGCIFLTFGVIITFTMHGFIEPVHGRGWSHKDLQHTALGLLFWSGGALSMWMGRNGNRNIWPAMVVMLTGLGMAGHGQASELSTSIHTIFGYTLVLAGICRIIEISFVLKGQHSLPPTSEHEAIGHRQYGAGDDHSSRPEMSNLNAFQHTMPFFLIAGGLEFMGATEEGISLVAGIGMDHVTYIIGLFCIAFTMYLWLNMLLALWATSGRNAPVPSATRLSSSSASRSSSPASWLRALLSSVSVSSDAAAQKDAVGYSHVSRDDRDGSMEMGERRRAGAGGVSGAGYRLDGGGSRTGMPPQRHRGSLSEEEDDGGDSYWDGATRVDDDAKSLQVR